FKAVGEVDQTVLLAHEAFSKTVAAQKLAWLARERETAAGAAVKAFAEQLETLHVAGLPVEALARSPRPVVSLDDARRVAPDFVVIRTLPRGLSELVEQFDLGPLQMVGSADLLTSGQRWLLVRAAADAGGAIEALVVHD